MPGADASQVGREEFAALAGEFTVVPVWRELAADTLTPVAAYLRAVRSEPGFLLESVEGGERWGRYSFVGRRPLATIASRGGEIEVDRALDLVEGGAQGKGILDTCRRILAAYRAPTLPDLPPLHSGLVGYMGYDVVREVEKLPDVPPDVLGVPDAVMNVIGQLVAFDHWRQRIVLVDNVVCDRTWSAARRNAAHAEALRRLDGLAEDLGTAVPEPLFALPRAAKEPVEAVRAVDRDEHLARVEKAKEYIRAGDAFQIVVSQRFDFSLEADPLDVYRVLRCTNPSPYMYFLQACGTTIVGSSPEPMVRLRDGVVISRPIAGTRRRGLDDEEDRRLAEELAAHPKEVAEHVMLVDLARNDVGRVARYGTVAVDELMTVERYSHVMHLTSQVSGSLVEGLDALDVLRATLPAGTLSGAPKVRAMEIIDELETSKRGPYGGIVGYIDFSGNLDTAIAIRTMVVGPDGRASVQAGGGIVADSDPDEEDRECLNKAAAILSAVPAAREMTRQRRAAAEEGR